MSSGRPSVNRLFRAYRFLWWVHPLHWSFKVTQPCHGSIW